MKNGASAGTALSSEAINTRVGPNGRRKGIAWNAVAELGVVPDAILAEQLGCTPQSVAQARKSRGIPASPLQSMRFSVLEARWRIARTYTQVCPMLEDS